MKNPFLKSDGSAKISLFILIFVLGAIGLTIGLGNEVAYNFSNNFFTAGVWGVLGVTAGYFLAKYTLQWFKTDKISSTLMSFLLFLSSAIALGSVFGPADTLASNRGSGIPDEMAYYVNGKVKDLKIYFSEFTLNPIDSIYVVTYGEEPGYNKTESNVRNGSWPASAAPRANEDWTRPLQNNIKKNF